MVELEPFPNLVTMFFTRAAKKGGAPFLWSKASKDAGGGWHAIAWDEVARRVASVATALRNLGLVPGDRVVLVSENRPEWCIADLAIMAAGCITVPTYVTNNERDHQHILSDSGARAAIVSTAKLARALVPAVLRSAHCRTVIGIEDIRIGQAGDVAFHDWRQLIATTPADVAAVAAAANFARGDTACIIYTSGTGGAPRGVKQHHGAILHNADGCMDVVNTDFGVSDEVFLSFLPLSHAYEHSAGQFFPIGLGAEIYYSEGLDKLAANIEEVGPTIMVVVPRLFEVLRARIIKTIDKQGGLAPKLLGRALSLGDRQLAGDQSGVRGLLGRVRDWPLDMLLDRTLRPKVRARFGGRLKAMVSGGAPLNPDIGTFFHSLGVTVLQGYGQTESGPVVACNRPAAGLAMDSVGPPLKNTRVCIADDGEILVQGENVMHGYWCNDAETANVLRPAQDGADDGQAWLHTGDVGHIDAHGRLVITDRKKDLIVNDKGDNVSPQKIEGMLTLQPEIIQAMVTGDKRPHLVGLVVPDPEWLMEWAVANDRPPDIATLVADPAVHRAVMAAVDRVNADVSVVEKVRRIALTPEPFTVDNEMMTPSLKIRRHVIRRAHGERLDALYGA